MKIIDFLECPKLLKWASWWDPVLGTKTRSGTVDGMGRSKEKNLAKEGGEENFAGGQTNGRTGPLKVA